MLKVVSYRKNPSGGNVCAVRARTSSYLSPRVRCDNGRVGVARFSTGTSAGRDVGLATVASLDAIADRRAAGFLRSLHMQAVSAQDSLQEPRERVLVWAISALLGPPPNVRNSSFPLGVSFQPPLFSAFALSLPRWTDLVLNNGLSGSLPDLLGGPFSSLSLSSRKLFLSSRPLRPRGRVALFTVLCVFVDASQGFLHVVGIGVGALRSQAFACPLGSLAVVNTAPEPRAPTYRPEPCARTGHTEPGRQHKRFVVSSFVVSFVRPPSSLPPRGVSRTETNTVDPRPTLPSLPNLRRQLATCLLLDPPTKEGNTKGECVCSRSQAGEGGPL